MIRSGLSSIASLTCLVVPLAATAQTLASDGPRRTVEQSLGASYNRLGIRHTLGVRWAWPLTRSTHPLLADAHLSAGLSHALTPAYTRFAVWAEVAPVSVLVLRAGVEPGIYFGAFGSLMSFDGYESDFSDDVRRERAAEARAGTGGRAYLSSTARAALGSVALTGTATLEWWQSSATGPFFYEPSRETLLRAQGDRLLTISTALVRRLQREKGGQIVYGVSYEQTEVLDAPGNRSQRLGIVVSRRFDRKLLGLPSPSFGARVAYCLEDPLRKGQVTAAIGISVER